MDEKLLYLVIGWVLGLFGPIITTFIQRIYQRDDIKRGIINELKEVHVRMALLVFNLSKKDGSCSKALLTWLRPFIKEYDDTHPDVTLTQMIDKMLGYKEEDIAAAITIMRDNPQQPSYFKSYKLHFLDAHIQSLSIFNIDFQRKIIEIKNRISLLNEEIELFQFYFAKTFDNNVSAENHKIIVKNIDDNARNVKNQLIRIIKDISNLISDGKRG